MGKITEYPITDAMSDSDTFVVVVNGELQRITKESTKAESIDAESITYKDTDVASALDGLIDVNQASTYTELDSRVTVHSFKCTKIGRLCQINLQFSLSSSMSHNDVILKIPEAYKPLYAMHSCFMSYTDSQYAKNVSLENTSIIVGSPTLPSNSWYSGYFTYISEK